MASRLVPLAILVSALFLSWPSYPQVLPPSPPAANTLLPGTLIDSSNDGQYAQFLPAAAPAAIRHGLKVRVVPTQRLDWSTGFTKAAEKYSGRSVGQFCLLERGAKQHPARRRLQLRLRPVYILALRSSYGSRSPPDTGLKRAGVRMEVSLQRMDREFSG
jgi:hypothetical protein